MKKIGITGGIGSGKSQVSALLKVMGIPVYIADDEAKRLTNSHPAIRENLIRRFGSDMYVDGALNKQKMISLVFDNEEQRSIVNSIIHPLVLSDFLAWAETICETNPRIPFAAIESAILFESGFETSVDSVILVHASEEIRMERVMKRDNLTRAEVEARIASQMSEDERIERSDLVVVNDGISPLIPQLEQILQL